MNKTEQKERLKDIISLAKKTIENLEHKESWFEIAIQKIQDLSEHLSGTMESDFFEQEDLIHAITNNLFETELGELFELAEEFKDEIDSYIEEVSELKQEQLLERYRDLEIVCEKFNQSNSEYVDIENAVEHLEEAIFILKEMCK